MSSKFNLITEIDVDISDTPESRQKGLMWRERLGKSNGMFFDFEKPMNLLFWGKNTLIPLDIAFIDDNFKIVNIERIRPFSTESIMSSKPCRYALEVNKGFFKKYGVDNGCHCKLDGNTIRIYKKQLITEINE